MTKVIPLTKGYEAIVDDDDYEYLSQWKWQTLLVRGTPYAVKGKYKKEGHHALIYMHRLILEINTSEKLKAKAVQHIDKNSLNNKKDNLRPKHSGKKVSR